MLSLRPANILDLPPLYALASDKKRLFLDDYHSFDLDYAREILDSGTCLIIDDHGYPAGVIWFSDQLDDLHCQVHTLVDPKHWREILKLDILGQGMDWAFETLGIAKILAECLSTQSTALRILRKYKFYEHKPFYKHTRQGGVVVDVIRFEARKNFWRRSRKC